MANPEGVARMFYFPPTGGTINLGGAVDSATAFLESKPLHFGQEQAVKYIDRIIYSFSNRALQGQLFLEIWGADDEDGPFTLLETVQISTTEPSYPDVPGQRYFKFRLRDDAVAERWRFHGMEVWGELGGDEF